MRLPICAVAVLFLCAPTRAQTAPEVSDAGRSASGSAGSVEPESRSTYVLGPDDQIIIRAVEVEEISEKPVRIDSNGFVRMPMIGDIRAGGLTLGELQQEVYRRLQAHYKHPQVAVSVVEYRSQPVSVIGSVRVPGVHQLQGQKSLVEMLSLAGGLMPDAGYLVKITRRSEWGPLPLANAVSDPTGQFSVAEVRVKDLMAGQRPAENILIKPRDVISVPRAEMVYVVGEVKRAGGFTLHENESMSVLQALSLAEGLSRTAGTKNARILRAVNGSSERLEIPVDLKQVMDGRASDVKLQSSDILFIPNNLPKSATLRGIEAAIAITTGLVIIPR